MAVDKKLLDRLKLTDPKVALLYEATGHLGPWTSAEFESVFPVVYPARKPRPEPPENVRQLLAALDEKVIEYEVARRAWTDSIVFARGLAAGNRVLRITAAGQQIFAHSPSDFKAADRAIDEFEQDMRAAEQALRMARSKHSTAERAWHRTIVEDRGAT